MLPLSPIPNDQHGSNGIRSQYQDPCLLSSLQRAVASALEKAFEYFH